MLGIEQKKGDPEILCGRLIAYAKILPSAEPEPEPKPFQDMARNGLLVIEGDFRDTGTTFKQYLQKELGKDVDKNIAGFIEKLREETGDLPEGLDPDTIRERMNELSSMEVIPIPARIIICETEEEILSFDGDIFYVGEFQGVGQAHFCLTSLPMFYQAKYREQEKMNEQRYLNELLSQINTQKAVTTAEIDGTSELFPEGSSLNSFTGNLRELLDSHVFPFFLALETEADFEQNWATFESFMEPYPNKNDLRMLHETLVKLRGDQSNALERKCLELIGNKISATFHEDFRKIPGIVAELENLLSSNGIES